MILKEFKNKIRINKVLKYIMMCWLTCDLAPQTQIILRTIERILRGETND